MSKKESTAIFFVNFGRSRVTKEPTKLTVVEVEVGPLRPIFIFLTEQEEELIIPAVALVVKEQNLNVFNSVLRILNEMHDRIFFMRR